MTAALGLAWSLVPARGAGGVAEREPFALFPLSVDGWSGIDRGAAAPGRGASSAPTTISPASTAGRARRRRVDLFMSWYGSQARGPLDPLARGLPARRRLGDGRASEPVTVRAARHRAPAR